MTQLELVDRLQGRVKQANLSAALNGKRQFTLAMLDSITEALELEKGSLYLYYEQECFDKRGNLRPQKVKEFILSCYQMGIGHVTRQLVNRLIEHGSENVIILFEIAERLYELGLYMETLYYYNIVIDMETGTRTESDRLAISCYRKFDILDRLQTETVHDAFVVLAGCLKNMPKRSERVLPGDSENLQFDAYRKAITYCMERGIWHRVMTLSEQMSKLAVAEQDSLAFGQSLLYKAEAALALSNGKFASQLVDQCAQLPCPVLETDIRAFQLRLALEEGDLSHLDSCLHWLLQYPTYLGKLLPVMLRACLKHNRLTAAAEILGQWEEGIAKLQGSRATYGEKKWNAKMDRLLAEFLLRSGSRQAGWEKLLSAAQGAISLNLTQEVIDCMLLHEEHRSQIPEERREEFMNLLRSAKPGY